MEINDYIKCLMGPIKTHRPFGIALWANRPPGEGFLMHSVLCEICTGKKPYIFIDDYLPMAVFQRTQKEQEKINKLFQMALSDKSSTIQLMSATMTSVEYLSNILAISNKITFSEFVRCLPEKKLASGIERIVVSEALHAAAELLVFEQLRIISLETIIIPQFAQAIVALHRNISPKPLSAIVTSSFAAGVDFNQHSQKLWHQANDVLIAIQKQPRVS